MLFVWFMPPESEDTLVVAQYLSETGEDTPRKLLILAEGRLPKTSRQKTDDTTKRTLQRREVPVRGGFHECYKA